MVPEKFRGAFCERFVIGLCEQRFFGSKKLFSKKIYKVSTRQFHTDPLSSRSQFNTRPRRFQHPKSLSSTPKPNSSIPKTGKFWCVTEGFSELKRGGSFCVELMCCTEGVVELRGTPNKIDYLVDGLRRDHPPVLELDDLTYF